MSVQYRRKHACYASPLCCSSPCSDLSAAFGVCRSHYWFVQCSEIRPSRAIYRHGSSSPSTTEHMMLCSTNARPLEQKLRCCYLINPVADCSCAGSPRRIDDDDELRAIHLDCCRVIAHDVLHHRLYQGAFAFDSNF
jgi:hypothetical protein